jgi:hypothetical protein
MATRLANGMMKLDMEAVRANFEEELAEEGGREKLTQAMKELQIVVYVMAGGGWLGCSAAEQPKLFYVDSRCSKRPYAVKKTLQATEVLSLYAEVLGLQQPLTFRTEFHNCGVF